MIRFYSGVYPNIKVSIYNYTIKFNKGIYDTDNHKEIEALKRLGFRWEILGKIQIEDSSMSVDDKGKIKHTIPARWSKEKIISYAKDNNIELPRYEMTRAELVAYIESL